MNCPEFLELYSDYRDDLLDPVSRESVVCHLRECEPCARYDRVVSGGVDTLLGTPELTPSSDFVHRLDARIAFSDHLFDERSTSAAPVAIVFAVAASIAAAAWLPALRPGRDVVVLPAVTAQAPSNPQELPLVFHPGMLSSDVSGYARTASYDRRFSPYSLLGTPTSARPSQVAGLGR